MVRLAATFYKMEQFEQLIRSVYSINIDMTRDFWASSLLRPAEPCKEVTVPVYDLNEEIHRINPTFLLMDIEGGEYDLIKTIDFHTIRKISAKLHTHVLGQDRIDEIKAVMSPCRVCG